MSQSPSEPELALNAASEKSDAAIEHPTTGTVKTTTARETEQRPQPSLLSEQQRERASRLVQATRDELEKVLIGQSATVEGVLCCLIASGHVLLEGVPGLGKTLLVRALAKCFAGQFARIQFTPDLMPSDVTGHAIYDLACEQFKLRKGPAFTHLLLADEINRAPAKTQAALLEVMQERSITLEGRSLAVPQPFMVLATQNPIEQEGTYPLPEAELDRFMVKLLMDYPQEQDEQRLVRAVTQSAQADILAHTAVRTLLQPRELLMVQKIASGLAVDEQLLNYAVSIVRATRQAPGLSRGAGPRASIDLIRYARARALLAGHAFVSPHDIKSSALDVLRHRVQLCAELEIEGLQVDQVLQQVLKHVPAPRL
ncbi:MAG TPA: MoxR family ATPase [Thiopseudomonas sp.]|nr:MoxR family ATPase [Thiopseudomonas sp.]